MFLQHLTSANEIKFVKIKRKTNQKDAQVSGGSTGENTASATTIVQVENPQRQNETFTQMKDTREEVKKDSTKIVTV